MCSGGTWARCLIFLSSRQQSRARNFGRDFYFCTRAKKCAIKGHFAPIKSAFSVIKNNPFPAEYSYQINHEKTKQEKQMLFILLKHLLFVLFNLAGDNLHHFNAVRRDCALRISCTVRRIFLLPYLICQASHRPPCLPLQYLRCKGARRGRP